MGVGRTRASDEDGVDFGIWLVAASKKRLFWQYRSATLHACSPSKEAKKQK